MTRVVISFLVTVATWAAVLLAFASLDSSQAQTQSPLVSPGGRYVVTFDCWPEWVTLFASAQIANGQGLNPCYAEELLIRRVRSDGWVEAEIQGAAWLVNLDRATGISVKAQTQAAR